MTAVSACERYDCERGLVERAAQIAGSWREQRLQPLLVGLDGDLGSGKTTWVRGVLAGLGHRARVPSPTYTLVECYELGGLTVVHADLYRLESDTDSELEALGLRDYIDRPATWTFVEWIGKSRRLAERADLLVRFERRGAQARELTFSALSGAGAAAVEGVGPRP